MNPPARLCVSRILHIVYLVDNLTDNIQEGRKAERRIQTEKGNPNISKNIELLHDEVSFFISFSVFR